METEKLKSLIEFFDNFSGIDSDKKSKNKAFMDNANVIMFITNNKQIQDVLKANFDVAEKIPELDYKKDSAICGFSISYLKKAIDLFEGMGEESVIMKVKSDFPLTLVGKKFMVILAPRVDENEEDDGD